MTAAKKPKHGGPRLTITDPEILKKFPSFAEVAKATAITIKSAKPHGGPRKGAGRPAGAKGKEARGRVSVTRSVSMDPGSWAQLDKDRKGIPRGRYIENKLGL